MAKTIAATKQADCWKCSGSGKFYMGGAVVNGVYTGKVGECFACQGKGYQTPEDKKRCNTYWRLNIHKYV